MLSKKINCDRTSFSENDLELNQRTDDCKWTKRWVTSEQLGKRCRFSVESRKWILHTFTQLERIAKKSVLPWNWSKIIIISFVGGWQFSKRPNRQFSTTANSKHMFFSLSMSIACFSLRFTRIWDVCCRRRAPLPPPPPQLVRRCVFFVTQVHDKWAYECSAWTQNDKGMSWHFDDFETTTRNINKQMFFTNRHRRFGLFTEIAGTHFGDSIWGVCNEWRHFIEISNGIDFSAILFWSTYSKWKSQPWLFFSWFFTTTNSEFAFSAIVTGSLGNIGRLFRRNNSSNGINRFSMHFGEITGRVPWAR